MSQAFLTNFPIKIQFVDIVYCKLIGVNTQVAINILVDCGIITNVDYLLIKGNCLFFVSLVRKTIFRLFFNHTVRGYIRR